MARLEEVARRADAMGLDVLNAVALVAIGDAHARTAESLEAVQAAQRAMVDAGLRRGRRRAAWHALRVPAEGETRDEHEARWRARNRQAERDLADAEERFARAGARHAAALAEFRRDDAWLQDEVETWKEHLRADPWQPGLSPAARTELGPDGMPLVTWTVAAWRRQQWFANHPEEITW